MALSLREVRRDPIANRALKELMHHYTVAEEKSNMKLFFYDLDDLHQWDFVHNQQMVKDGVPSLAGVGKHCWPVGLEGAGR
jgi:hypothetical protein